MIRETYCVKRKTTTLSVTNNKISAILKADTVKTGLRLYDNGCIGIAGTIGNYDESAIEDRARHMLRFKIPYDCPPASDISKTVDISHDFELSDEDFLQISTKLLDALSEKFPRFSFSHKLNYEESELTLTNDAGARLVQRDKYVEVGLLIKHKASKNLFDGLGFNLTRMYDFEDALNTVSEQCASFEEKSELPAERMPVVFLDDSAFLLKFHTDLNGRLMATDASIFAGKIGQKLFNDAFTLRIDRDPRETYQSFFDAEGSVLPDNTFNLIENGVLISPYTSKKIARQYDYPITGAASGEYDSVPDASPAAISIRTGDKTIKELLGGRKAVFVATASGGDFTSQGEFATPAQCAYIFDGERFYGRLPQLSLSSNIYDMFGKDFIGRSIDGNSPNNPFKYTALEMNVKKIDDWL